MTKAEKLASDRAWHFKFWKYHVENDGRQLYSLLRYHAEFIVELNRHIKALKDTERSRLEDCERIAVSVEDSNAALSMHESVKLAVGSLKEIEKQLKEIGIAFNLVEKNEADDES